jgi:2-methylcitrate dehydratase
MDNALSILTDYVVSAQSSELTSSEVDAGVRHHLDGVGCAAGAFNAEPCHIAREIASSVVMVDGCSAYGVKGLTTPEYAAFANSSANRHLDYNDSGIAPARGSGGHPNDMAPGIMAAVELVGGSGRDLIFGTHVGYEVFASLGAVNWRKRGWDQGAKIAVSTAAAAAKLFGLDRNGVANAISLAITPGTPLRVVRTGELSHWKGSATAFSAMAGLFAARLAQRGMTGPQEPFEGEDGLWKQVTGPFEIKGIGEPRGGKGALERTFFKFFPAEYNSQGPVASILKLREGITAEDVESIDVTTYYLAWHEIGGGQGDRAQKWDPKTRESADHSLPYMVAVALTDGMVSLDSFSPKRVADPALRPLMNKISVTHDPAFDQRLKATGEWCARTEIRLRDGRVLVDEVNHPKGSIENPMDDDDLKKKFDSMIGYVLAPADAQALKNVLWSLERAPDLTQLTSMFRAWEWRGNAT